MVKITGVTFTAGGKVYYFAPGKDRYEKGMGVIVDTARGLEYATVVIPFGEVEDSKIIAPLKPVVRIATNRDREQVKRNVERKPEAMRLTQEKIDAHKLVGAITQPVERSDGHIVVIRCGLAYPNKRTEPHGDEYNSHRKQNDGDTQLFHTPDY